MAAGTEWTAKSPTGVQLVWSGYFEVTDIFKSIEIILSGRNNPVELNFEGFLAPSITSWADAERYTELSARLQVEVIPQAQAYIGYRRIRFDTNDYDDVNLDRSVHLGIKLTF